MHFADNSFVHYYSLYVLAVTFLVSAFCNGRLCVIEHILNGKVRRQARDYTARSIRLVRPWAREQQCT